MKDADEILDEAETKKERVEDFIRDAADFFHGNEGKLFKRKEARQKLKERLDISERTASELISQLVSDTVDPVVQVQTSSTKYVGVVEFHEFEGAYGYIEYDDVIGKRRRVVCQKCVNEAEIDKNVTHATEKSRSLKSSTYREEKSYEELLAKVHDHYEAAHDVMPEAVKTGASLASGATIGGNTAIHEGTGTAGINISGDADSVDGKHASDLGLSKVASQELGLNYNGIAGSYHFYYDTFYVVNSNGGVETFDFSNLSWTPQKGDFFFFWGEYFDATDHFYVRVYR